MLFGEIINSNGYVRVYGNLVFNVNLSLFCMVEIYSLEVGMC